MLPVCAREALYVNFMREAVVWGASPNFMMMRPNFRYPQLWMNVQEIATVCSSLSHWKYLQQTTKAFMLGRGQGMSRSVPLSESPFEE
ncbi:hypothetical protein CSPX01_03616 [Colletotrichum filicis]|nr:hypothetical protein CSPX01_03616 [Colletotrichum filicis]